MSNVGIKNFSYRPNEIDYNEFISVLTNLLLFHRKSGYWKFGSDFRLFYNIEEYRKCMRTEKIKNGKSVKVAKGNIFWTLHASVTTEYILKYFKIDESIPVDIYIKPRQIILKKFKKELDSYGNRKPFYPFDSTNLIVPISEKVYLKLKQLPQPFNNILNFYPKNLL